MFMYVVALLARLKREATEGAGAALFRFIVPILCPGIVTVARLRTVDEREKSGSDADKNRGEDEPNDGSGAQFLA
jgi:hypothetical protein